MNIHIYIYTHFFYIILHTEVYDIVRISSYFSPVNCMSLWKFTAPCTRICNTLHNMSHNALNKKTIQ